MVRSFFLSLLLMSECLFASNRSFNENFEKWLFSQGIKAQVVEARKEFDENQFLKNFFVFLEEKDFDSSLKSVVQIEVSDQMSLSLKEKNVSDIPYFLNDWIAKLIIEMGISRVARLLGLPVDFEKLPDNYNQATIWPARSTSANHLRFERLVIKYKIENLLLNLNLKIDGPDDYVITDFVKSELNALVRTLEAPSERSAFFTFYQSRPLKTSPQFFSDLLLREFLQVTSEPEFEQKIMSF